MTYWLLIFDQPVVITPVSISDDVIQYHKPLKLELKWSFKLRVDGLILKPVQLYLSIFVALDKRLKRANLLK